MDSATPGLGALKRALFWILLLVLPVAILELGVRVVFAQKVGPSVLRYGFGFDRFEAIEVDRERFTVAEHGDLRANYSKYHAHQTRRDYDRETGESFDVSINAQGFRGRDFRPQKEPGVLRVVALGSSSTFGFTNRDDETYPVQLERLLGERCPSQRVEVLNLGIPPLESDQILSLFLAEGLPLEPDIVTFYEGNNDAAGLREKMESVRRALPAEAKREMPPSGLERLWRAGANRSLALALVDNIARAARSQAVLDLEEEARGPREKFIGNLDRLVAICRESGIELVVATQQALSRLVPREEVRGLTYAGEVERVKARLALRGGLRPSELKFLVHDLLMKDLRGWAVRERVPLVDVIEALDAERDVLVTHVHLSPRGNRLIAELLAAELARGRCP
jgi:hypothetical protein